jgi:hypothetical protein
LTKDFLCFSERILFSRYYDSSDLSPLQTVDRPDLKTFVAISSPIDLERYGLAAIDTSREIDRLKSVFRDLPTPPVIVEQVSLNTIIRELRNGCNVLYLVCHGAHIHGDTRLWLQGDDGRTDIVSGEEFVKRIQNLPRPPLLVVLASCQTGTFESEVSGVSLGPSLAAAGVPAVIAMQGNVTMHTIESLMPLFFSELLLTGVVDHSLAIARADLRSHMDWWMPVLFMRRWDGRLWTSTRPTLDPVLPATPRGLRDRLRELKQLHLDGLISDQEYDAKRASILSEL